VETDREQAARSFVDIVRQAVARRHPGERRWAMPLSGGRDSRYLLLSLLRAGARPECCVTTRQFPPRSNIDAEVAAGLTESLCIPHVIVDPLDRFQAECAKNLRTHFLADEHAWFVSVANYLEREVELSFDGIGGDTLSGHWLRMPWRKAYEHGRFDEVAGMLVPQGGRLRGTPGVRAEWITDADSIRGRIVTELRRFGGTLNPVTQFMFWSRTRREIGLMPTCLVRSIPAYAPYLDTELYEYLSGISPEVMEVNTIHDRAFELEFPEWNHLPFSPYGTRQKAFLHYAGFTARMLAYSATRGGLGLATALKYPFVLARCLVGRNRLNRRIVSPARVLFNVQLDCVRSGGGRTRGGSQG
jgi:hypothetical protein